MTFLCDLQSFTSNTISSTGIVESTLRRRFNGQTVSYSEARSRSNRHLTNAQESVILEYLNKLSARGLHATPQMLENLVVEMIKQPLGDRWIQRFCKRHTNVILSIYLRGIDQARTIADNTKHFQSYFDRVCVLYNIILIYNKSNCSLIYSLNIISKNIILNLPTSRVRHLVTCGN